MGNLTSLGLTDLRTAVPYHAVRAPHVSVWSVGMHVQHCCLSMQGIHETLAKSRPPAPWTWRSLIGRLVLTRGRLPRGRARAPKFALPSADVSPDQLTAQLDAAEQAVAAIPELDRGAWIRHFALGIIARDDAIRFIGIHNRHHLAIIRDILAATGTRQWEVHR